MNLLGGGQRRVVRRGVRRADWKLLAREGGRKTARRNVENGREREAAGRESRAGANAASVRQVRREDEVSGTVRGECCEKGDYRTRRGKIVGGRRLFGTKGIGKK
uniref:Uncharacterized protein n=1 Tax=Cucumis sativus TaxID=3659 RepID=A0A0A0KA00_CUCSA